jgi:methylthioribulose-1-phosphate dehydratase
MNYLDQNHPDRQLLCELCRHFYSIGWASGTGGGIALSDGEGHILIAPSGVQKERLKPDDLFVIDVDGNVLVEPTWPGLKVSECAPLFLHAFRKRGAGAVLHSHSLNAMIATRLKAPSGSHDWDQENLQWVEYAHEHLPKSFVVSGFEMIKGLRGKGCFDKLVIPVIENTAKECDLADSMAAAMDAHPDVDAVLVRSHGVYVWGQDWRKAKTQAECLDYLFQATIEMVRLGIDPRHWRR